MILLAENLQKSFRDKNVLKGINLKVDEGEVHAILGRNGAGKSTFIKIALGLVFPSDGKLTIYENKPGMSNHRIGYLSENITLYPHLSAADNLRVAAYSANASISSESISEILKRIDLSDAGNRPSKAFSLGMKRRLQLAMSTMTKKVDFLILDEPTNGLDVNGLLWLKQYINELRQSGVSILLASHAIFDLQDCITDYVIFNKGLIAKSGKWDATRQSTDGIQIIVAPEETQHIVELIGTASGTVTWDEGGRIQWKTKKTYKDVCAFLYQNGVFPENVSEVKKSLESVFLEAVKETDE